MLLLGATGTGKSTLIDAIINYMAGESYNDDCRFSVINLEDNHRPDKQVVYVCYLHHSNY